MKIINKYDEILNHLADSLNLTENQIQEAESRYKAVGKYLSSEESTLKEFNPSIEPQGSFLYGTMIMPIHEDGRFDIDLICKLENLPVSDTQSNLKNRVGNELKSGRYRKMLESEGRRCWTINYADESKFHLDILPAVPDENSEKYFSGLVERGIYENALKMTDINHSHYHSDNRINWPKTNPKGYFVWFKQQMQTRYESVLKSVAIQMNMSIEDVPNWKIKTPLQKSIQILKRHRDVMFGEDEYKPISIIITTLAAKAYANEVILWDSLHGILERMEEQIEYRDIDGRKIIWISNPVNPTENFADKWETNARLKEYFYEWIKKAQADLLRPVNLASLLDAKLGLEASFGATLINNAYEKANIKKTQFASLYKTKQELPEAPHKEVPKWPLDNAEKVKITGRYKNNTGWYSIIPFTEIPKGCEIHFHASTSVKGPIKVYWQVVNTGTEAIMAKGLRGEIFPSKTAGRGGLKQKEHSKYKGTHWVECYIIKDGDCVGKGGPYIVKIE